jgi:hypothetical protein
MMLRERVMGQSAWQGVDEGTMVRRAQERSDLILADHTLPDGFDVAHWVPEAGDEGP